MNNQPPPPPPGEWSQQAPPPNMGAREHEYQQNHRQMFGPPPPAMGQPQHQPPQQSGHFVQYHTSGGPSLPQMPGLSQPPPQPRPQPQSARSSQQPYPQSGLNSAQAYGPSPTQHHMPQSAGDRPQDSQETVDRQVHIKEEQDALNRRNQRDAMEGQRMEQLPPHQIQHGQPLHLHQPVAVGPRTARGPNGLLADPAQQPTQPSHAQIGAPQGQQPVYAGGPVQPGRAPSGQPTGLQAGLLMPGLQSMTPQSVAAAQAAVAPAQQPILNDALSYLDQVKGQFASNPDVYNRFLDIMKDFKSGVIDTPGVIDRVSSLFAGNPQLIQGFNTFLPPGYKIECGLDDDPNAIRVTTPLGHTLVSMPGGMRAVTPGGGRVSVGNEPGRQSPGRFYSPSGRPLGPGTISAQLYAQQARERDYQAAVHQQEQRGVSQLQNAVSAATNGAADGRPPIQSPPARQTTPGAQQDVDAAGQGDMKERPPVEFNHAISYVNKIKNRFAAQPDIYKQFLEILQTYQRESKPIQDVFGQVTKLFHTAPDLLEDFKQFLPESAAHAKAAAAARQAEEAAILSNVRGDPNALQQTPRSEHRLPPVGNFAPTPIVNKDGKRKRNDRPLPMPAIGTDANGVLSKQMAQANQNGVPNKRAKYSQPAKTTIETAPLSPTLVPALPEPIGVSHNTSATPEELAFFDRVKKIIGNKNTMNEFLKLCNLFNQDLIDRATLAHRARPFIGGNADLLKWFQTWLGCDDEVIVIENQARVPSGRIALSNCRALGPSYRLLPKRDRLKPCSGRDELCNEVLNDDWASHPTWASEDSGFIAHRKNVHEEGLHKIEEERHDYDHNIEAVGRTIQLLEPIALKLLSLSQKEREALELPGGMGGQSETIHKKIIMKVYGRETGRDVIEELHVRPYHIIPVLLNRLKQKSEEWKSAQREWEKVWRDQTQKMFWKSLDHQAVNAKQADKRQFQTKTLVGEIQIKYEEQKKQRMMGAPASHISQPQMVIPINDLDVVVDATYLVLTYAEQIHSTEFPRLAAFLKEYIPMFFGIDIEAFDDLLRKKFVESSASNTSYDVMASLEDVGSRPRKPMGKKDDLRRGVLERGTRGRNVEGSNTPMSRASTPGPSERADEEMSESAAAGGDDDMDAASETWAEYPPGLNKFKNKDIALVETYSRSVYNLYGNVSIYCFLRMFVILYERLCRIKSEERQVHKNVRAAMAAKPAIDLGLVDKLPSDFFPDVSPGANYYQQILEMLERFVVNGSDFGLIEETLRRYYMSSGWQLYSFEKLASALVRFAIGVMGSDTRDKSWEIMQCFKKDRIKRETTYQDEMGYRKQVERLVKDGDVYKIAFNEAERTMSIRAFKRDEPTFEIGRLEAEDNWRIYVIDYLGTGPTPGSPLEQVSIPVLKRNVRVLSKDVRMDSRHADGEAGSTDKSGSDNESAARRLDLVRAKESLEFKIAVEDLSLHFNSNSEEYFHQPRRIRVGASDMIADAEVTSKYRSKIWPSQVLGKYEADAALGGKAREEREETFMKMKGAGPVGEVAPEDMMNED